MAIQIKCDNCGRDLSYSNGGYDHCLILKDREYGPDSNIIIDYYIYPLLDEDKYLCDFGCLKKWMEKEKKIDSGNLEKSFTTIDNEEAFEKIITKDWVGYFPKNYPGPIALNATIDHSKNDKK